MTILAKVPICAFAGWLAQSQIPPEPGLGAIVEKGGAWALVGILMWWILGKLSGQIDRLITSVDTLSDKLEKHGG